MLPACLPAFPKTEYFDLINARMNIQILAESDAVAWRRATSEQLRIVLNRHLHTGRWLH